MAPDKISWTVTVDDPTTWTRPWSFGMPLTILDSEQMQPYECHEGNYGLVNMLEIARAADKKDCEARRPMRRGADMRSANQAAGRCAA